MSNAMSKHLATAMLLFALVGYAPRIEAQLSEEEAVVQVVQDLFDGMRSADSGKLRAVFAEGATLAFAGTNGVQRSSVDGFVRQVGSRPSGSLDERIWDWQVQIDGPLASVWTKYDIVVDGNWSHCGVDAFHLHKSAEGWKIFHLADTRRRDDDCWRYPGG